jgi:hypothetical protein
VPSPYGEVFTTLGYKPPDAPNQHTHFPHRLEIVFSLDNHLNFVLMFLLIAVFLQSLKIPCRCIFATQSKRKGQCKDKTAKNDIEGGSHQKRCNAKLCQ